MNKESMDEDKLIYFGESKDTYLGEANLGDLKKAYERMGIELGVPVGLEMWGKKRLKWLLNFVHLDLSKMSTGDWINLRFEFLAFQFLTHPSLSKEQLKQTGDASKKDIKLFHSSIKKELNRLIDSKEVVFDIQSITIVLKPRMGFHKKESGRVDFDEIVTFTDQRWEVITVPHNKWSSSQYNLVVLITPYAHRIRRCPECTKIFFAERKDQSFCSTKHKGYAAMRKYRKSKGLITGKPRGRPRKNPPKNEGES